MPDTPDRILQLTVRTAEKLGYRVHLDWLRDVPSSRTAGQHDWILVDRGLSRLGQARRIAGVLAADPRADLSQWNLADCALLGLHHIHDAR